MEQEVAGPHLREGADVACEKSLQFILPPVLNPENVEVHRQLIEAIEAGDMPELEAAIYRHDHHRLALGMFEPAARDGAAERQAAPALPKQGRQGR